MNLLQTFKGQYPDSVLEELQQIYNLKVLTKGRSVDDVTIDPLEELPFPAAFNAQGKAISWAFEYLGTDHFIEEYWQILINSPYRLVFIINDTAGKYNPETGLDKYVLNHLSGDATGRGIADDHNHSHMVGGVIAGNHNGHETGILRRLFEARKAVFVLRKIMSQGSGLWPWIYTGINTNAQIEFGEYDIPIQVNSYGALGVTSHPQVDAAIDLSISRDHCFLASSGNSGTDPTGKTRVGYPAIKENVAAIGAIGQDEKLKSYSSTGPEVWGVSVSGVPSFDRFGNVQNVEGTSFSQPIAAAVVGLISLYLGEKVTQDRAFAILAEFTKDLGAPGRDPLYGYGVVTDETIGDDPGDKPDDPEPPEEPGKVAPYTLLVGVDGLTEMYQMMGSSTTLRVSYGRYELEVTADLEADLFAAKVRDILNDWMGRHFVQFPADWRLKDVVGYLGRVTDMHLTEEYGIVTDVTLMEVEIGGGRYIIYGDQIRDWKTSPDVNFDAAKLIAINVEDLERVA